MAQLVHLQIGFQLAAFRRQFGLGFEHGDALLGFDLGFLAAFAREFLLVHPSRAHDRAQDHLGPRAVLEPVDAERAGLGKLALLAAQLALDRHLGEQRAIAGDHLLALEPREQVGEALRFELELPTLLFVGHSLGRGQRHRDIVLAAMIEDDVPEHLEILLNGVVVDVVEAAEDLEHRAGLCLLGLLVHLLKRVHRPAERDHQQTEIDKDGDAERDIVAFAEAGRVHVDQLLLSGRVLDRLDRLLLLRAQLLRARRQLELQRAKQRGGQPAERLDHGFRTFGRGNLRALDIGQAVDRAHDAAQRHLQLRIGALELTALGVGERGLLGALGEIHAHLLELRIAAERVEAGDGLVQPAAHALQEIVARAGLGINDAGVGFDDLGQIALDRGDIGLHLRDPATDKVAGELEAFRVALAHRHARTGAGPAAGARIAVGGFLFGLLGRHRGQRRERRHQLFEVDLRGVERAVHLADRGFRRACRFRAAFEHLPVEAEREADRNQRQEQIADDVERLDRDMDRRK